MISSDVGCGLSTLLVRAERLCVRDSRLSRTTKLAYSRRMGFAAGFAAGVAHVDLSFVPAVCSVRKRIIQLEKHRLIHAT